MTEPLNGHSIQLLRDKAKQRIVELERMVGLEQPKPIEERLRELERLVELKQAQKPPETEEQVDELEEPDRESVLTIEALELLIKRLKSG